MENSSTLNSTLAAGGIISFILGTGIFTSINQELRIMLLLLSPGVIAIACFFIFLKNQDNILEKIENLEKSTKRAEDLIDIKSRLNSVERLKR